MCVCVCVCVIFGPKIALLPYIWWIILVLLFSSPPGWGILRRLDDTFMAAHHCSKYVQNKSEGNICHLSTEDETSCEHRWRDPPRYSQCQTVGANVSQPSSVSGRGDRSVVM